MDAPRCDQTEAWAALEGHYEAHGRELDLRDIFTFTVDRTAAGGAVEGSFHPTGEVPRLADDHARGSQPLDSVIFKRTTR